MGSKLVIWFLSPLGMSFCLAGLALALAWRRRFRSSMALAALPDALALDASGRAMKELVGKWVGW